VGKTTAIRNLTGELTRPATTCCICATRPDRRWFSTARSRANWELERRTGVDSSEGQVFVERLCEAGHRKPPTLGQGWARARNASKSTFA
jgi:hypothetical protein